MDLYEEDSWSYTSTVLTAELQRSVSTLRNETDRLQSKLQKSQRRISELENEKYHLQKQNKTNQSKAKELQRNVSQLSDRIRSQESEKDALAQKNRKIQELSELNADYSRKLEDMEIKGIQWSFKSNKLEKDIKELNCLIQDHACSLELSQSCNKNQQNGTCMWITDTGSQHETFKSKMKWRFKQNRKEDGHCRACQGKGPARAFRKCGHYFCQNCLEKMSTEASKRKNQMTERCFANCPDPSCAAKHSLNEIENLMATF